MRRDEVFPQECQKAYGPVAALALKDSRRILVTSHDAAEGKELKTPAYIDAAAARYSEAGSFGKEPNRFLSISTTNTFV